MLITARVWAQYGLEHLGPLEAGDLDAERGAVGEGSAVVPAGDARARPRPSSSLFLAFQKIFIPNDLGILRCQN